MKRIAALIFTVLTFHPAAHACSVCFGSTESTMLDAMNKGIFVMLGITGVVLGGFALFFLNLRKRAARAQNSPEAEKYKD